MAAVLLQLELASTTPAATFERTSSGKRETAAPKTDPSPAREFRGLYDQCKTDAERRQVIDDALAELRTLRYAKRGRIDRGTLEGKLAIGRDRRPARIVAYVFGYTVRHIYRLRADARKHDGGGVP